MKYRLLTVTCALGGVPRRDNKGNLVLDDAKQPVVDAAEIWTLEFQAVPANYDLTWAAGPMRLQTSDKTTVDSYELGVEYDVLLTAGR